MDQLQQLAGLYDVKTSFLDMENQVKTASSEAFLAILKALGAPVSSPEDIPSAARSKREERWKQMVEPVIVAWENEIPRIDLHLPSSRAASPVEAVLTLENGESRRLVWRGTQSNIIETTRVEGLDYCILRFEISEQLPPGYHKLRLDLPGQTAEALIISAPVKAYIPFATETKIWGAFIPLYALHSSRSWGAGDFSDMETLMDWVRQLGGRMIGTLPLMPSFFDKKYGPGPYMPASRLFWNEFYVDILRLPELKSCRAAQALLESAEVQKEITELRSAATVDYPRQAALKRRLMEELSGFVFTERPGRYAELLQYVESNNSLEDYARFRAAGERQGINWNKWPERMRKGILLEGDYDEKVRQYYLYSQYLAGEQAVQLARKADSESMYLYLDLPVGVHPDSYDVWREQESFVRGVNGGAPPDPVFTSGQNWGFPPLHPEKIRQNGYRYLINSLEHQCQYANLLRIDHIMNFHRLFWVPEGMENREGVYVGYRAEELYAILTLESCRHRSVIVGEDLGMVPPEVRPMMEKHGIYRMFVGQYELIAENRLGKIPEQSVASLNTHDMFPFASFWQEKDISERLKLNLLNDQQARKELEERKNIKQILLNMLQKRNMDIESEQDIAAILKAVWVLLAGSPAYAFLVNLEDLWLETNPQNVPGTLRNENWSRKARRSLEEFSQSRQVLEIMEEVNRARISSNVEPGK
jgi:4-alpha-glucanotransferase